MEDFLREKLEGLEHGYQNDWPAFEKKLKRALFFRKLKIGAMVSAVLILFTLSVSDFSLFDENDGDGNTSTSAPQDMQDSPAFGGNLINEETSQRNRAEDLPPQAKGSKTKSSSTKHIAGNSQNTSHANDGPQEHSEQNSSKPQHDEVAAVSSSLETGSVENEEQDTALRKARGGKPANVYLVDEPKRVGADAKKSEKKEIAEENSIASLEPKGTKTKGLPIEISSLSLDEALQNGKATELSVRPPLAPVKLEISNDPYISPLQKQNPWSLSVSMYPNFTFREFKVDPERMSYIHRDFIDATQASERGGFSLNVGFRVSRRIGPITYLNSGLEYISHKTQAEFDFTNFRDAGVNAETGEIMHYTFKPQPEHISFSDANLYHYLNIPLSISHQPWATDHIRLNIEAGASFMYFLSARGKSIDYRSLEVIDISERDYRNQIGSFSMKVGATYHVSQQFNFGLEPTMMYFTNTIYTEEYPFEVIPYSVGVNLKLEMKLN